MQYELDQDFTSQVGGTKVLFSAGFWFVSIPFYSFILHFAAFETDFGYIFWDNLGPFRPFRGRPVGHGMVLDIPLVPENSDALETHV